MNKIDTSLLQVTKLSHSRTIACNQAYFDDAEYYYVYLSGKNIHLAIEPPVPEPDECYRRKCVTSGRTVQQNRVICIPSALTRKLNWVPGKHHISVRRRKNKFILSKATKAEIETYGTKTPKKAAVSGEVRNGRYIFFTNEEKKLLGISSQSYLQGYYLKVTFNIATAAYITAEKISDEELHSLPTLSEFLRQNGKSAVRQGTLTYKYKYPQSFLLPAAFVKSCGLKSGDVLPSTIVDNKIIFEAPGKLCSFCGKPLDFKTQPKHQLCVCKSCTSTLPDLKDLIVANGADVLAAAKQLRQSLDDAIAEYENKKG